MTGAEFLELSVGAGFAMVFGAVLMAVVRLARGPSLPDRVVALDLMTVAIVAFCGLMAIAVRDTAFLDVALVLALVGFLATVALSRFAERARLRRERDEKGEEGEARD
ncbi:multisubunit sodium/proton antiporter MrpF subunit [Hasllibacter halocynthiae]|uniref:Multisubunit sodium/proton antiporter MrpF subunit n=1 Tax=Hasllibacter halocynthiae TaxID=595589 RepID=A0A2T0X2E7_9RHOB|nr:monovalent cation/H+ antiporter complex subunit F [Hasllibacter halocynthiae]PRY93110.1 multisubunit sodium/proton antiporter MrpF subunit [Hasllibacter halocynthiae]